MRTIKQIEAEIAKCEDRTHDLNNELDQARDAEKERTVTTDIDWSNFNKMTDKPSRACGKDCMLMMFLRGM